MNKVINYYIIVLVIRMNIHLIIGNSRELNEEKINEIVANGLNIIRMDLDENNIEDVIEEAGYLSLFSEQKYIVVKNTNVFSSKKSNEKETNKLLAYFENPNPETTIVFVTEKKLDERKKITKLFKSKFKIHQINELKDKELYLKVLSEFEMDNYKISSFAVNYIIKSCLEKYDLIYQEINKLKLYKIDDKIVTDDDVIEATSISYENNIFDFTNSVIKKDIKKAFLILENLKLMKQEPIVLLVVLANQYRLMYQSKALSREGKTQGEIAKLLRVNPNAIWHSLQNGYNYSFEELLTKIENLADLDYKIKSGEIDRFLGFDVFLLNI